MDYVLFVGSDQTTRDLGGIVHGLSNRNWPIRKTLAQRMALQELRNNIRSAVVHTDVINGHDIGMAESGGRARLLFKPAQTVAVLGERRLENFYRDIAPQTVVTGAV